MVDLPDGEKAGLGAAVAEAVAQDGGAPDVAAEQLALLPLPVAAAGGDAGPDGGGKRGPGRPPGAKNRNTEAWRDYILSRYQSPLVALAETYSRPLAQLAQDLGFVGEGPLGRALKPEEALELFKIQLQAAKELAPYVHSKQPIAVEAGEQGLIQLIINAGAASEEQVEEAGAMKINFLENQEVIEHETQNSVAAHSVASDESRAQQGPAGQNTTDQKSVDPGQNGGRE